MSSLFVLLLPLMAFADAPSVKECNSRFGLTTGTAKREPNAAMNDIFFDGREQRGEKPVHNECGKFSTAIPPDKLNEKNSHAEYEEARRLLNGLVLARKNVIETTESSNEVARAAEDSCATLEKDFSNSGAIADFNEKMEKLTKAKKAAQDADDRFIRAATKLKPLVAAQNGGGKECAERMQKWIEKHECYKIQNADWLAKLESRCKRANP